MANLNIAIEILANDKASGPLGRITGQLEQMGSRGFRGLRTIGVAALGAVTAGVTALGAGFVYAGKTAVDMNAQLETSTLQFTTLMGDAGAAEAHVRSLFEFAKRTPFETGPIIEASRMMQTFGGEALNSQDNLLLIGDAAAATSAPIDELGFWVGRLYSNLQAGQPFGEAAMRLQELAVMSPEARQKMEELQAAGAGADEIFAVFQEDLDKFSGAMEDQAGTWEGLTSTIKDALAITAATALKPFFDLAKDGLGAVADFLSSPALTAGVELFATRLAGIGTMAGLFMDHLRGGMPFMDAFRTAITQTALVFGMAGPQARALGESVALFLNKVQAAIQPVWEFVQNNVQLSDVLYGLGAAVAVVVIPAIVSIVTALAPVILAFGAVVAAVALVRNAWENNWGGIQEKTKAVIDFIVPLVQDAIAFIQQWWAQNGDAILLKVQQIWTMVQTVIAAAVELVRNKITTDLETIRRFWETHGTAITNIARQAWGLIKTTIQNFLGVIRSIWDAFRALFEGDWFAFGEALYDIWESTWTLIIEFFGGLWDMLKPLLVNLWQSIRDWWGSIDWGSLGRRAIDGIVAGLQAAAGAIVATLRGIISNAIASAIAAATGGSGSSGANSAGYGANAYSNFGFSGGGGQLSLAGGAGAATAQGPVIIQVDARGATPGMELAVEQAVNRALLRAGLVADARRRM